MNAPISQEPGDWIEWSGGECPVAREVAEIQVRLRSNRCIYTLSQKQAEMVRWANIGKSGDIIAYRVVA